MIYKLDYLYINNETYSINVSNLLRALTSFRSETFHFQKDEKELSKLGLFITMY